jgi:crotonobetainyl-CoA:carnitine CoA-transferase CaiB-like acyl-CoA transferase
MSGPLSGVRVIEMGQLLAGPFCGQLLGDLGAEVIKIEPPGQGDPMREWGQVRPDGISVWFAVVGRNKTFATLDLRTDDGRDLLKRLAAKADILVENFRPGTLEKWGLGWEVLHALNPRLILTRVSGYGQTGPYAAKAGYASVGEAFAGFRYPIGEPDRLPSRTGTSIGDSLAATFATLGAVSALNARAQSGRGQIVDSAIYEACLAMMESLIPDYQFGGLIRERTGSFLPRIAPSNIYPTADGMVIIGANQDTVFARLAEAMGEPTLAADPRYAGHIARGENQAALDARVGAWTRTLTSAEVQARCDAAGVPCGPVNRAPDLLAEPHIAARDAIVSALHPELGPIKMQAAFPKFSETPGAVRWPAKPLGADNDYVWRNLAGLSADELAAFKAKGVI